MINITLAPDDIRVKYPTYGLDLRMPLSKFKISYIDLYGSVIRDQYWVNGQWVKKDRVLIMMNSKLPITLDFDWQT